MVAEHAWSDYRAGGVLRCEREKGFWEISGQAEGRDCHLPGGGQPLSAKARRSTRADEPTDAAASGANGRAADGGSVCGFPESSQGGSGVLEAGRRGGGQWRVA